MLRTPLLSLLLLLVDSITATLDDVDEGSGIAVDSSLIAGSAIMETDRKMTDPFLSSPPRTVHKLLLVDSSTATLDDVDEGSGIAVDSSVIAGSAILETDRKITDPLLSSPPRTVHKVDNSIDEETSNNTPLISTLKNLSASLPFDMGSVMVEKEQAHNYATTVTEDSFSHRITIEEAGNMSIKGNPLPNNTKIEKRMATSSDRENRSSHLASDTLSKEVNSSTFSNTNNTTSKNTNASTSILPTSQQLSESSVVSLNTAMVENLSPTTSFYESTTDNGPLLDNKSLLNLGSLDKKEPESEESPTTSVYASSTDISTMPNGNVNKADDKFSIISTTLGSNENTSTSSLPAAYQTSKTNTSKSSLDRTSTLNNSAPSDLESSLNAAQLSTDKTELSSEVRSASAYQASESNTKNPVNTTSAMLASSSSTVITSSDTDPSITENEKNTSKVTFTTSVYKSSTVSSEVSIDGNTGAFDGNASDETKSSTVLLTTTIKPENSSISTESNELMSMSNTTTPLEKIHNNPEYLSETTTSTVSTITTNVDPPITDSIIEVSTLNTSLVDHTTISITPLPLDTDGSSSENASYTAKPKFTTVSSIEFSTKDDSSTIKTLSTRSSAESAFTATVDEITDETATENVVSEIIFSSTFESPKEISTLDESSSTTKNVEPFTTNVPIDLKEDTASPVAVENLEQRDAEEGSFPIDTSTDIAVTTLNVADVITTSESLSVFTVSNFKIADESRETFEEHTQQSSKLTSTDVFQASSQTESSDEVSTILNTPETVLSVIDIASTTLSTVEHMNNPIPFDLSLFPATPSIIEDEELNQEPFPDDTTIYLPVTSTKAEDINNEESSQSSLPSTEVSTHPFIESTQSVSVTHKLSTELSGTGNNTTHPSLLTTLTVTEPGNSATQLSALTASTVNEPGSIATQPPLPVSTVTEPGNITTQTSSLATTAGGEPGNNSTQRSQFTTSTFTEPSKNTEQPSPLITTAVTEPGNTAIQTSAFTTATVFEAGNNLTVTQPSTLTTTTFTELGNNGVETSPLTTTTVIKPGNITTQPLTLTTTMVTELENITTQSLPLTTVTINELGNITTQPSQLTTITVTESGNLISQPSQFTTKTVNEPGNITTEPSQLTTTTVTEPINITMEPSQWTTTTVILPGNITTQPSLTELGNITDQVTTETENITTQPSQLTTTTVIEKGTITTQPSFTKPGNITTQNSLTNLGNITTKPSQLTTATVPKPQNITIQPSFTEPGNITTQHSQLKTTTVNEPGNIATQPSQLTTTTVIEPGKNATQPSQLTTTTVQEPGDITTQPSQLTTTTVTEPANITTQPSPLITTTVTEPANISTQPSLLKTTTVTEPANISTQPSQMTTTTVTEPANLNTQPSQLKTTNVTIPGNKVTEPSQFQSTILPSDITVTEMSYSTFPTIKNTSWSPQLEQTTVDVLTLIRNGNTSFFDENESTTDSIHLDDLNTNQSFDRSTQIGENNISLDQSTQPFADDATFISMTTIRARNLDQECVTYRGPDTGRSCTFPFFYHGKIFFKCTYSDDINEAWCSTEVDSQYRYIKNRWGYCNDVCPKEKSPCVTTGPSGKEGLPCVFPFHYMHMMFWGCTSLPSPGTGESRPWCPTALDDHLDVLNDNWGYCSRKCLGSGDILIESPLFTDTSAFDQQDEVSSSSISTSLQTEMSTVAVQTSLSTTELDKIKPTEMPLVNANLTEIPCGTTNVTEIPIQVNVTERPPANTNKTEIPLGITNVTEISLEVNQTEKPPTNMNQTELPLVITNVTEIPHVNTNLTDMPLNVTEKTFLDATKILPVDMNVTEIPAVNTNSPELPAANTTLTGSTTEKYSNQNSNRTEIVSFGTVAYETHEETTKVSETLAVTNRTIQNGTEIVVTSTPNSQSNVSMTESPDTTFSDQTELPVQITDFVRSTTSPQFVSTDKVIRICGKADRVPPQDDALYIPSGCWDPVLELLGM